MTLITFAEGYVRLLPGEQALFSDVVRRLLADGFLWREDESDRRLYHFLARHREMVAEYLQVGGWDLRHDEGVALFQVVQRDGMHRRRLKRETTIWLLILRMIYAEQQETLQVNRARYPTVTAGDVIRRYAEFFPGQATRKKTSFDEAMRTLQASKIIRPAGGGTIRAKNPDQLIALLPALAVVVPASTCQEVALRLHEFDRSSDGDDEILTGDDDDREE